MLARGKLTGIQLSFRWNNGRQACSGGCSISRGVSGQEPAIKFFRDRDQSVNYGKYVEVFTLAKIFK